MDLITIIILHQHCVNILNMNYLVRIGINGLYPSNNLV